MSKQTGQIFNATLGLAFFAWLLFVAAPKGFTQERFFAQMPSAAQDEEPTGEADARGRRPGGRRERDARLLERLGLSPEQRAQIRAIRQETEAEGRPLMRRLRQARRALDEAVYSESADEATVDARVRELALAQEAFARLRAFTEMKVRRVLTPQQLAIVRDLRRQALQRQLRQRRGDRLPPPNPREADDNPSLLQPAPAPARQTLSNDPAALLQQKSRRQPARRRARP
ncbi:MAG TPA: periplasmic heavy metal sensor [Pyrinomonadaceae bacterium]